MHCDHGGLVYGARCESDVETWGGSCVFDGHGGVGEWLIVECLCFFISNFPQNLINKIKCVYNSIFQLENQPGQLVM